MARQNAIKIHRSDRMENLVAVLESAIAEPLCNPLTPEVFVVQSRGMELWLNQEIAKRHGVAANLEFLYPKNFIQRVFSEVLGESLDVQRFTRDRLLWAILAELPELLGDPSFASLHHYLSDDRSGHRQLQLCEQIAKVFDQYLTYRPELIRRWEEPTPHATPRRAARQQASQLGLFSEPRHEQWQQKLWARTSRRLGGNHIATLEDKLLDALTHEQVDIGALPERLMVFGISALPPIYVRILVALARHIDVRLFLLSPCREYWADLPSSRGLDSAATGEGELGVPPLLSSLGLLSAQFEQLLGAELEAQRVYEMTSDENLYQIGDRSSLLGRLQAELLDLEPSPRATTDAAVLADHSIQIHSCHSPLREVEVLHDQLLDSWLEVPGSNRIK